MNSQGTFGMNGIVSMLDEFGACHKARGCLEASPGTKTKRQEIVCFLSRDEYLDCDAMESPPSRYGWPLVIVFFDSFTTCPYDYMDFPNYTKYVD